MFAAVIVIASCSRKSTPVAIQPPIQPEAPVSAPSITDAALAATPAPAAPGKAKTRKRRPATVSYVNPEYGISFRFPRAYGLKSGDAAQLSWGDLGPFQMDFVHPGGVTLAGVQLPADSYPGTDFNSGFLNLSVNPRMTAEACTQFAFPEGKTSSSDSAEATDSKDATGRESKVADKTTETATKVKIGAVEFTEVESSTTEAMKQTDAKYYHAFNNGACYEFALGIGTKSDGNVEGITPVDRQAVFGKLEKILATVKLQPAAIPEAETSAPSAKQVVPDASSNSPGAAGAPEQSAIDRNF
jgi:hypothetical protein